MIALNSSFIFAGQGLGAVVGGLVLDHVSINYLGYGGGALGLGGFLIGAFMLKALPLPAEIEKLKSEDTLVTKKAV
jgi:predicted MFS family arabinose efflux permease